MKRSEFTTKKTAPVEQRLVDRPVAIVQGNVPTNTQVQIQEVRRTPPTPREEPTTDRTVSTTTEEDTDNINVDQSIENPWIQVRDKRKPTPPTAAKPQNPGAQPATSKNQTSSGPKLKGAVRVRKCVCLSVASMKGATLVCL